MHPLFSLISSRIGSLGFHHVTKHFLRISLIGSDVSIVVMRHLVGDSHPSKVDFLGIYIEEDKGLSESPYGLLGKSLYFYCLIHQGHICSVVRMTKLMVGQNLLTLKILLFLTRQHPYNYHLTISNNLSSKLLCVLSNLAQSPKESSFPKLMPKYLTKII